MVLLVGSFLAPRFLLFVKAEHKRLGIVPDEEDIGEEEEEQQQQQQGCDHDVVDSATSSSPEQVQTQVTQEEVEAPPARAEDRNQP